jgi:hypothetical protein
MIKKIAILIAVVALSGCTIGPHYFYNGQRYDSNETFQQAVNAHNSSILSTITRLPTPLTQRKLIFAIPTAVAFSEGDAKSIVKVQGREFREGEKRLNFNLNVSYFNRLKVFFEAIQKRKIYASTKFIEMDSTTGSFAASPDVDALFLVRPGANSLQWYYTSHKHGKQIFSYDQSNPTEEGKVQAFIDAVQALAIRD